jgi:ribosomal protein L22
VKSRDLVDRKMKSTKRRTKAQTRRSQIQKKKSVVVVVVDAYAGWCRQCWRWW